MQRFLNIVLVTLITSRATTAQRDSRPCGLKTAPCPSDQECIPDSPDCTDINRCLGHCKWTNVYADCGGFRAEPKDCDVGYHCDDDPRDPESCGMACDMPGICIPNDVAGCDGNGACQEGLWCYEMTEWVDGEYVVQGCICL